MDASTVDWFADLESTGQPAADVCRFLRGRRPDTLRHASRVAAAGRRLARRFGLDRARSDLACLAHDLAAVVPARAILAAAEAEGVLLTPADRAIPQVVHGPLAAAVLRARLGVADAEVLAAVAHHTTLRARAGPLECLVFIADKLAPDPSSASVAFLDRITAVRDTASLPELCWIYVDWAVREGPPLGWRLHPNLLAAHAELAAGHDEWRVAGDA